MGPLLHYASAYISDSKYSVPSPSTCQDTLLTLCDPCESQPRLLLADRARGVGVGLCLRGVDVGGDFKLAPGRGGGANAWSLMLALKLVSFVHERAVCE